MNTVTLMSKNIEIMKCVIDKTSVTKIEEIINKDLLPICLQENTTPQSVTEWIKNRIIPETRDGLKYARTYFKFEVYKNMFSLTDQYWFRYSKKDTWDKLNYFTNDYSTSIGNIFFAPWSVGKLEESPDLTTNGVLRKRWRKEDGKNYLIKAGNRNAQQSPLSEVLASMMLEQIDIIPFVKYDLCMEGLKICCKCENFVDENSEFVPAMHIYNLEPRNDNETVTDHMIRMAESYGIEGAADYIERMIVADHMINNNDRNLGNFGFLREAETGKIKGFAPLFDCGSAFWPQKTEAKSVFNEKEKETINKYLDQIAKKKPEKKAMVRLVTEYPGLTDKEEADIIENIKSVFRELKSVEMTRIERMKEDDLPFK